MPTPIDNLFILPAFGADKDFADLYSRISWHDFLIDRPDIGQALFQQALAAVMKNKFGFDHVLIDSRTGLTDLGGLLTAVLPHATVLVGGYGHQSVHGLQRIKRALQPAVENRLPERHEPLQLLLVASPVPADRAGQKKARQEDWRGRFSSAPMEIPFESRLLYDETLLAVEEPESPVGAAYNRVFERVVAFSREHRLRAEQTAREAAIDRANAGSMRPSTSERGFTFEERVARALELQGFVVEREQLLGGNRVDLVVRRPVPFSPELCFWVECKDHKNTIGKDVLEKMPRPQNLWGEL